MRSYISYDELEELGETIVRAYINKTRRYNALCVDIYNYEHLYRCHQGFEERRNAEFCELC